MKTSNKKMIISYLRNSRIQQENSLEVQSKLITEFCENQNIKLDKIICDEGVSGSGEKTNHRKGYNSIIRMIENGEIETIIDDRASTAQREALGKILKGESTAPGTTIFSVLSSTMSTVHDTLYRPIDVSIDIDARRANLKIAGLVESTGTPMKNPFTGENSRAQIHLPNGFEYTYAEIGVGTSKANGSIPIELSGTHGQFCVLHMNQDGVIR